MTNRLLFLLLMLSIGLTSCVSTTFYQVYKAEPKDNTITVNDRLVFEDNNCIIYYDFWGDGGDIGFEFYNKTDENIHLNMDASFFIRNGIAYDYYLNRVYTEYVNNGSATINTTTKNNYLLTKQTVSTPLRNTVSITEDKTICIPSKTSKIFKEYNIVLLPFRHCDLEKFPKNSQIQTAHFTDQNSPLTFSNRLSYTVNTDEQPILLDHEFYVSEITNYPQPEIYKSAYDVYCGAKTTNLIKRFVFSPANKFYFKYTTVQNDWIKL